MDPFAAVPAPGFEIGPWLLALWATLSAVALLSLGASFVALERRGREWKRRLIDGQAVWVAADTGPAVVGFVRSRIVLPEWVLERSETERGMVLAHEAEHLRAGDPRLIFGTLLLVVALPWNLALWWQWRRLREAVEVDCDLRVIGRGLDPRAYGRLLVEVTERGTARRLAVAALSESRSSLERRINLMFTPEPRRWRLRAAGAAALAAACIVVACTADIPSAPGAAPAVNASGGGSAQDFAYEVAVLERAPELSNAGEIAGIMERLYPTLLQNAGIGGTVVVQFVIEPDGTTDPASLKVVESQREELAAASIAAVRAFRFRPGRYRGENVRVLIQMPVTWRPRATAAAARDGDGKVPIYPLDPGRVVLLDDASAPTGPRQPPPPPRRSTASGAPNFEYEVAVLDAVPALINKAEIAGIMESAYPPPLQSAGIGGTVVTQFVIAADGTPDMATAKVLQSSDDQLSAATLTVLERFRFRPGVYKGQNVRTLIQMPITWQPKG